ncbi:hypothetical protein ACH5RR_022642 [Cinchona calisaya]|uniref:Uncharacterized protein n=1 Tax=Cinchona calisaya TaxID=153742 RepID=A0ABD2ZBN3_9GENT
MLLNVLFNNIINEEKHSSIEDMLLDRGLLYRVVRRNCWSMVEVLLRYYPDRELNKSSPNDVHYLFRPDVKGLRGLTPPYTAAGRDGSEHVLDALTDDRGLVGVEAWRIARESTGLTPNDYACLQGHYSYIHLVQKKIIAAVCICMALLFKSSPEVDYVYGPLRWECLEYGWS